MTEKGAVGFLSAAEIAAGDYYEDPEYSARFEPVLRLIWDEHDIKMDATLSKDEQIRSADQGILTASFDNWHIGLNWSPKWNEGVPPHHYRVRYRGEDVACMSPYMLVRTCPFCKLGDPWDGRRYHYEPLYMKHYLPTSPVTGAPTPSHMPSVMPAHACRGPFVDGRLLGTCRQYDWFGGGLLLGSGALEPADVFQRDCAEEVAKRGNDDSFATTMAIPDNLDNLALARDVQA